MAIQTNTGTLTNVADTVTLGLTGDPVAFVYVYGTYTGANFVFEATPDGTNWYAVQAYKATSGATANGTLIPGSNATVGYFVCCGPLATLRIRLTAISTGTVNVVMEVGPGTLPMSNIMTVDFNAVNVGAKTAAFTAGTPAALVASGPGIIHSFVVTTAGTASNVFYDNASAASGTVLYGSAAAWGLGTQALNTMFQNGVYFAGAASTASGIMSYTLL